MDRLSFVHILSKNAFGLLKRFFSKTGFIIRPHRRCIGDDLAENLFFCKANLNFLKRDRITIVKMLNLYLK